MKTNKYIDSHVHISMDFPLEQSEQAFRWFNEEGHIERTNFLALNAHTFFQETQLDNSKCLYLKTRFAPYGYAGYCLDYTKPNTAEGFLEQIKLAVKAGFDCWKIIEAKPNSQCFWKHRMDDEIYEPAFNYAEEKRLPIIVHVGDPIGMWEDEYKEGYLQKEEYQQQMYNVLERHPNLVLTFAHFGFMCDKPEFVENMFKKYKTVYLDNVPGPEEYFVIAKNPAPWKRLMEKYSDRFIFGTDRGNHGTEGFTKEEYFKHYPETVTYELNMLTKDGEYDGKYPFEGYEYHWGKVLYGLNLSDEAFNNIVYNNFMRIYGEPKPVNYECLYEIAKHEFALPSKSPYLKSDYEKIVNECKKHGVKVEE